MSTAEDAGSARPIAPLQAAAREALAGWRSFPDLVRRGGPAWLAAGFLVAGLDATRTVRIELVVGAAVLATVVPLAWAATRPTSPETTGLSTPAVRFGTAVATAVGVLLVLLAGAPVTALLIAVGVVIALVVGALPSRIAERWPGWVSGAAMASAIAGPALLGGVAALAGARLPGPEPVPPGVPLGWIGAWVAWLVGAMAVQVAFVDGTPGPARRWLGWTAVAAWLVTAALAATHGALGALAAIGLASYVLVGLMAVRDPAAAAAERPALDRLVGAWLLVLLLQAWAVLAPDPWVALILVVAAATGWTLVAALITRLATRRRRPRTADDPTVVDPSVLLVLPLVGPVADLRAIVLGMRSQTYADPRVVVVALPGVDTAVAEEWLGEDAVLVAPPVPPGWTPRAWAAHVAMEALAPDAVLLLGEDVVLAPVATRVLVEHLQASGVDALGAEPREVLPTVADRAAGGGLRLWRSLLEPRWWVTASRGRPARLVGPDPGVVVVRAAAYTALTADGRHWPRSDGALLRAFAEDGRRMTLTHGADLATAHHAGGISGAVARWGRWAVPLAGGTVADALAMVLLYALTFAAPLILPVAAAITGQPLELVVAACIPLALLGLALLVEAIIQRGPLGAIPWHPVTVVVALAGQLAAIVAHVRGRPSDTVDVVHART